MTDYKVTIKTSDDQKETDAQKILSRLVWDIVEEVRRTMRNKPPK